MNGESTWLNRLHGQTGTVHGDAFAKLEIGEGSFDGQLDTAAGPAAVLHRSNLGDDSSEHQIRSRTSRVSSPRAFRSITRQRSAWSSSRPGRPEIAGMASSP